MPVREDDSGLNSVRHLQTYAKIICIQTGMLVQQLAYTAVKRMVDIPSDDDDDDDDDGVEASGDDPLAAIVVDGLRDLAFDDAQAFIKPIGSIAALFSAGAMQRSLKPKLYTALSLRDGVSVVGAVVSCLFARDRALSTELFTHAYCARHGLPRFDARWALLDVIASREPPSGALLTLHAILAAARSRPPMLGVCAVAVTSGGHRLLRALNFTCYQYREHGSVRHMCYLRLPADLSFTHIKRKLRFDGDTDIVESICWREPLSSRALSTVVGRC
jgi:hypothetical protein